MKKLLGIAVAAAVLTGVAAVYAGDAKMSCCSGGKDDASCCADDALTKLNLTADQQARAASLKDSSRKATSTSERIAMYSEGLAKILTPAQLSQWKTELKGMKNGACPAMSGNKSS